MSRYDAQGIEAEFEPGSHRRVLRNHLGIQLAREMSHAELVLIHPFREGNGRCARLLALLMGLQAGLPPLDFGALARKGKHNYIAAIHAAVSTDYVPTKAIFLAVVRRSLRRIGQ